ncbi:MAG: alpha/beta hydrolase domain-containing protein [Dehalococcoidia bacterium]|nr:alpha/beta hydrolase domain-containing protein [Dehalococcoidia bacterium]
MASVPTVEGPITGPGAPFLMNTSPPDALAAAGYEAQEYFISGTARSYRAANDLPANGMWEVEPDGYAGYRTRILVYRPVDAARFNGTVVMEWFNVSGGLEAGPAWTFTHTELLRRGYVWIGVSAQYGGVEGNPATSLGLVRLDLKTADPGRYASLSHPGDDYCYDIFSQAAAAVRHPGKVNPLAGCRVERILGVGESQSAMQLTVYVNAIQPRDHLFDGFLLHGRPCSASLGGISMEGADLSKVNLGDMPAVFIRTDTDVPVLMLESETDVMLLGYYKARQADTDKIRLWEMAGTAHADLYVGITGMRDAGSDPSVANVVEVTTIYPGVLECPLPINSGPQHFIAKAAIHQLDRWVRTGMAPAITDRIEIAGDPPAFVLDAYGNVKGGIRTPYVDVPIAKLSGLGQPAVPLVNSLFGTTELFDDAVLSELYPDHQAYVTAVANSTDAAIRLGFLMPEDGELIKAAAAASRIGIR